MRQIAVNLERLRWLPRNLPADRVWVNLANAQLVLYRDNQPVFTTRVVVGEVDKQTPELQTTIDSLLFNPPWNVPLSIASKEILPKLSQDPDYLDHHHMVMRNNGAIQQLPGAGTALGQLKFEMQDRFDVYLHDTPLKGLFARDNRRQSHGCVRVQNPRELAALLAAAAGRGDQQGHRAGLHQSAHAAGVDPGVPGLPDRVRRFERRRSSSARTSISATRRSGSTCTRRGKRRWRKAARRANARS